MPPLCALLTTPRAPTAHFRCLDGEGRPFYEYHSSATLPGVTTKPIDKWEFQDDPMVPEPVVEVNGTWKTFLHSRATSEFDAVMTQLCRTHHVDSRTSITFRGCVRRAFHPTDSSVGRALCDIFRSPTLTGAPLEDAVLLYLIRDFTCRVLRVTSAEVESTHKAKYYKHTFDHLVANGMTHERFKLLADNFSVERRVSGTLPYDLLEDAANQYLHPFRVMNMGTGAHQSDVVDDDKVRAEMPKQAAAAGWKFTTLGSTKRSGVVVHGCWSIFYRWPRAFRLHRVGETITDVTLLLVRRSTNSRDFSSWGC